MQFLRVYRTVVRDDTSEPIDCALVCRWHRDCFAGFVHPEVPYLAGNMRQGYDARTKCLNIHVLVGGTFRGSPPLSAERDAGKVFFDAMASFQELEEAWSLLEKEERVERLADIVARLMGGFNEVHPFAGGNGRMTRLMMKWALARYGFRTRVRVFERPTGSPSYTFLMNLASNHHSFHRLQIYILDRMDVGKPILPAN